MEIQLPPDLEALLILRAEQEMQTPDVYATRILARELGGEELARDLNKAEKSTNFPSAKDLSKQFAEEARRQPLLDLSEVYGSWGRAGHAVDGVEYDRELRAESRY